MVTEWLFDKKWGMGKTQQKHIVREIRQTRPIWKGKVGNKTSKVWEESIYERCHRLYYIPKN